MFLNVFVLFLMSHFCFYLKHTKLQMWWISHVQIAFGPVFDLSHNHHRLNGSSSHVLTATSLSYAWESQKFDPHRIEITSSKCNTGRLLDRVNIRLHFHYSLDSEFWCRCVWFQITSYGGRLRYTVNYVAGFDRTPTTYPDIELLVRPLLISVLPGKITFDSKIFIEPSNILVQFF